MILHENALITVPFRHSLKMIKFDTEYDGSLKLRIGVLPLCVPTEHLSGLLFKDIGSYSPSKPLHQLLPELMECIRQRATPFLAEASVFCIAYEKSSFEEYCSNSHLSRLSLYLSVLCGYYPPRLETELSFLLRSLKNIPIKREWEHKMLKELEYLSSLIELDLNAARDFLLETEEQRILELGLTPYLKLRVVKEVEMSPPPKNLLKRRKRKARQLANSARH